MKKRKPLTQREFDEYVNIASKMSEELKDIKDLKVWSRAEQVVFLVGFFEMLECKAFTRETFKEFDMYHREFYIAVGSLYKNGYLGYFKDKRDKRIRWYVLTPRGFDIALFILKHFESKTNPYFKILNRTLHSLSKGKIKTALNKSKNARGFYKFVEMEMLKKYEMTDIIEASTDGLPIIEKPRKVNLKK